MSCRRFAQMQQGSSESGSTLDGLQKGGTLGSALTNGSANYEVQLTDHHLRLLRMRTSADLEGIELGPELGRGSFGRVYKGARRLCPALYLPGPGGYRAGL